jgi:hypothetical protein
MGSYHRTPDSTGLCGPAPEGRDVYSFVLAETFLRPSGAADPRADAAPHGACQLFLAGTIYILRRWRFPDALPTKSDAVSRTQEGEDNPYFCDVAPLGFLISSSVIKGR